MILVDTCVLLDVVTTEPVWGPWSTRQLADWSARGPLLINPLIYAEFCAAYDESFQVEQAAAAMSLDLRELPRQALFLASRAHRLYRRRGGHKTSTLPDFLIGAHARVQNWPILTRDPRRFKGYFTELEIVSPH